MSLLGKKNQHEFHYLVFSTHRTVFCLIVVMPTVDKLFSKVHKSALKVGLVFVFFQTQNFNFGYTYLNEDLKAVRSNFSKYIINSLKHHFTANLRTQFTKNLSQSIVYKYAERATGESYGVVDAQLKLMISGLELSISGNNIFNATYVETGIVPMPKGNVLFGLRAFF